MPKFPRIRRVRRPVALTVSAGIAVATGGTFAATALAAPDPAAKCDVLQPGASPIAENAVRAACEQHGVPYTYGGGHDPKAPGQTFGHRDPSDPRSNNDPNIKGFDCSGLTRWAYFKATGGKDIIGSGTTTTDYNAEQALPHIAANQGTGPLLPGDLLYYGSPGAGSKHHVAMYIGDGKVVQASESGTKIGVSNAYVKGDYVGAIRIAPQTGPTPPTGSPTPPPPPPTNNPTPPPPPPTGQPTPPPPPPTGQPTPPPPPPTGSPTPTPTAPTPTPPGGGILNNLGLLNNLSLLNNANLLNNATVLNNLKALDHLNLLNNAQALNNLGVLYHPQRLADPHLLDDQQAG
ncbi:C40 family peptidase [Streptomyces sp. NPDC057743]|uniref:C40 family peptidase n=1 Tax=Streptomyces sp. NPDC057743 TaxID=3346236 RepID=UPI00369C9E2D